jgi:hypothetical protein
VHQPEASPASAWKEHLLLGEALGELFERAPHLEGLGIDMLQVSGDWPRAQLDVLARFPHLRVLELWFGFSDWRVPSRQQPALMTSSAARLFTVLRHANGEPDPTAIARALGLPATAGD